ncbi:hypothetical protein FPV67DRAFT_1787541 [Lyophyllum atratum]|nr:hypothetical protein FPV67DRAFT_1787541 [Lyophyllum atratum]
MFSLLSRLLSIVAITIVSASLVAAGGDLKLCTKRNLVGHCVTLSYLNNECIELGSGLEDKVRSVRMAISATSSRTKVAMVTTSTSPSTITILATLTTSPALFTATMPEGCGIPSNSLLQLGDAGSHYAFACVNVPQLRSTVFQYFKTVEKLLKRRRALSSNDHKYAVRSTTRDRLVPDSRQTCVIVCEW